MTDPTPESPAENSSPAPLAGIPKRKSLKNAVLNWTGMGVEMSVALFLMPYLIHSLGEAAYGSWIIIGALTGYLGNLDFGMRGSVGRHMALYHARGDRDGLLSVINSAALAMGLIGLVGLAVVGVLAYFLSSIADVPAELLQSARYALLIAGVNLGCNFMLRLFDAALWGYQRFDLLNFVDIPAALLRCGLAIAAVNLGYGLIGLACVSLLMTLLVGVAKLSLTKFVDSQICFSVQHIRWSALRDLWSYGIWNSLNSLAGMARAQVTPVLVSATLGVSLVTAYSVAARILNTALSFLVAGTGVLVPLSTAMHARDDGLNQRGLFLEGSKLCVGAALFFCTLFVLLGQPLLAVWIGPRMSVAWVPLVILACGELIPMSLAMGDVIFLSTAKNRPAALRSLGECATALALGSVLWRQGGLTGICTALAISAAIWRGIFGARQAIRIVGISMWEFAIRAVLPIVVAGVPAVGLLALAVWHREPASWPLLFLYGVTFSIVYWISCLLACFGWSAVRSLLVKRVGLRSPGGRAPHPFGGRVTLQGTSSR